MSFVRFRAVVSQVIDVTSEMRIALEDSGSAFWPLFFTVLDYLGRSFVLEKGSERDYWVEVGSLENMHIKWLSCN